MAYGFNNDKSKKELVVDNTPTNGSTNPVTSGGVYTALSGKSNTEHKHGAGDITSGTLATDRIPNLNASKITAGTLPVARGGTGNTSVDTTPTSGSTKMVTSGGVYNALAIKKYLSGNDGFQFTAGIAYINRSITFSSAFSSPPRVMLTVFTASETQGNVPIVVLTDVTSTGFKYRAWRQVGSNLNDRPAPSVHWVAVL